VFRLGAVVQRQIHDLIDLFLRERLLAAPTLTDLRELDQLAMPEVSDP
jgi:hypothetical protein